MNGKLSAIFASFQKMDKALLAQDIEGYFDARYRAIGAIIDSVPIEEIIQYNRLLIWDRFHNELEREAKEN